MKDFDYGVFVGRFQPVHLGHMHVIEKALEQVETLIVVIGSAFQARTPVNPFTFEERKQMLQSIYRHEIANDRLIIIPATDDASDDIAWARDVGNSVQQAIVEHANHGGVALHGTNDFKIALAGFGKDASSFYLQLFPRWASIQIQSQHGTLNASDIRKDYFRLLPRLPHDAVHPAVDTWLKEWTLTDEFRQMVEETHYYREYPKTWGKGPFVTADALVKHRRKILLIERGRTPGRGLLALPGGFVNLDERIMVAAERELLEETGINLEDLFLDPVGAGVFDDPRRSLRGRIIAHVFAYEIPDDVEVGTPVGSDDAARADWFDFEALKPEQFFEDHHTIITKMLSEDAE